MSTSPKLSPDCHQKIDTPWSSGQRINAAPPGAFVRLHKLSTAAGSVEARKLTTGVMLYWRFTFAGKTARVEIGPYDPSAPPKKLEPTAKGYGLAAATAAAEALAKSHKEHLPIGGHFGRIEAERQAAAQAAEQERLAAEQAHRQRQHDEELRRQAQEAERQAQEARQRYSLAALLRDYVNDLERRGRTDVKDARSTLKNHVITPWPDIASLPACEVTPDQLADMIRLTHEKGAGRTSNKVRSYLHAAFERALSARTVATVPLQFKGYGVQFNPASVTRPNPDANRADKNPLLAPDLRNYWRTIEAMPGIKGAALRLHLLTGGQRIAQLVRLRTADIGEQSIVLFDSKGAGGIKRRHSVPLTAQAAQALRDCKPAGTYALSTDGGTTHIAPTTLSAWAKEAPHGINGFTAKRIRSGVETLLAGANVNQSARGRLQSHGVSGVQSRHYDGHDYAGEKRQALEMLAVLLAGGATVTQLHRAA